MAELYSLPDGWEWVEFSKIFYTPTSKPYQIQKTEYLESGLLPIIDQGKEFIIGYTNSIEKKYLNESNCIIFGDHTRQIKYVDFDFVIGADGTKILKEKDKNKYDLKFLYFQFLSKKIESLGYSRHFKLVKEMFFAIPSLEEQKRIVAKLDVLFAKIDKAIALHQKNIDEADIFMASILNDVFVELEEKYEKKYLDEISFLIDGDRGSNYPKKEEFFENEFCLFLNAKNVTRNGFLFLEKQFITKEKDSLLRKGKLDREDLIITTRGTIGNVAIYDKSIEFDNVRINSGMAIIRLKEKNLIYNRYIYKYLFAPQFLNYLSDVQSGSAQPQITIKNLKESIVPIPPLKTQQKVVAYLDEISNKMEKIKQIQKEKMQSLKELKASILDKAFKGEL
ncbi:restriction endonuclease subunit S [Aliarcobacter skirrowii]|uniref:restriction endonuclease subunit S n=1 Tax=Aliarcobacter skirrowii TaxID=28200 RepID=UPI0029B848A9|nr:restriction endonuclease subunit S [Aliarcobacter skirrowii]MDX4061977.1 restriction endonuclease subunit S [Aliarcobacter skirrowii]